MKKVTYIAPIFFALAIAVSGCQKLEELDPQVPSANEVEAEKRRGTEDNVFEIPNPGSVRSDDVVPIDDGPGNVNDDDDNEDGDEVQGVAKRS